MVYQDILISEEERKNFIKGLVRLAKSDGEISFEEQSYFMSAAMGLGLNQASMNEINSCLKDNNQICVCFESRKAGILLLREGIQLCALDNDYTENERTEIQIIAAELGISEDIVLKLEKWVEQGMEWKRFGDTLLEL